MTAILETTCASTLSPIRPADQVTERAGAPIAKGKQPNAKRVPRIAPTLIRRIYYHVQTIELIYDALRPENEWGRFPT